jgi:catechol 2,3-dioxygenase-like lactoylglutathione lyase family enzyme
MRIDHIQLAMPRGQENAARQFYGAVLGMSELPKPEALRANGGCWFRSTDCELHLGIDPEFRPQRKAHPGFVVADLAALALRLGESGAELEWDDRIVGVSRFFTHDPFGNRLEFRGEGAADSREPAL